MFSLWQSQTSRIQWKFTSQKNDSKIHLKNILEESVDEKENKEI